MSDDAIITQLNNKSTLLHLAKTPIKNINDCFIKSHPQLYALGYNTGGRPDGLWMSRGSDWLRKARELDNPKFPVCCYIYKVVLNPDAKILYIRNDEDFDRMDKEFPSYWLNMDYFTVDFTDCISNKIINVSKKYKLDLNVLRKCPGDTMRDIFINNKIIFTNTKNARRYCNFYKTTKLPIERFKYKDWNAIASQYQGIIFENWRLNRKSMKYLWFQSLDVSSGCIWDASCIDDIKLLYNKTGDSAWSPRLCHSK